MEQMRYTTGDAGNIGKDHSALVITTSVFIFMLFLAAWMLSARSVSAETQHSECLDSLSNHYRPMVVDKLSRMARKYSADNNVLFFVDYSILSNRNRFFVWKKDEDKIVYACWCAHGNGGKSTST